MKIQSLTILIVFGLFSVSFANLYIATAPKTIKFNSDGSNKVLRRRELPSVINFLMGLSADHLHKTESWEGVKKMNIFSPPKANLFITVHAPNEDAFVLSKYLTKYATDGLEASVPPVFELHSAIFSKYHDEKSINSFVLEDQFNDANENIDFQQIRQLLSSQNSVLETLPFGSTSTLDQNNDVDIFLFGELQMMKNALDNVDKSSGPIQSFYIMLTSVDRLVQEYGAESSQVKEAIALLQYYIPQFIESMNSVFHGQLLSEVEVTVATPDVPDYLIRHSRSLLQAAVEAPTPNITNINLAQPSSSNFAVMFSIIFWLMVMFFLAVLAVSYSMWFMDPGKDNIIYRVTGQRIKME